MDFSLPPELTQTPLALVAFVGLDLESRHQDIWSRFQKVSSATGSGPPLKIVAVDPTTDDKVWPTMKPKRSTYEWFIPKGILKQNWMHKHLSRLPSVVVLFLELDWGDQNWAEKQTEAASKVQSLRATLQGRTTKLCVVLIQADSNAHVQASSEENSTASERASGLCSACELSTRSLFVLPVNAENLSGYVLRLENAFHELAQNYYHQEIRNVKSHREYLNKTTHLSLFVRHQFKAGFLNELKRDLHSAYKNYGQAYSLLMEVRATDTNIHEVKTIAGFISYKICKLAFKLNLPRDAISQFRKHMDIFQQKVGMDDLAFEHRAWQSRQCEFFADLFAEAIKAGLPAIQTQHPGLYYQQAAQHAIGRREACEELCADAKEYPSGLEPLASMMANMEHYGQRPWRPNKVALETTDTELENLGVSALLYTERTSIAHSDAIIAILEKSIAQFSAFKSPRSQSHLTVTMAEELKSAQRYREALDLLQPVMAHYRKEKWRALLDAVLSLGVKCAFLLVDVTEYLRLTLELASDSSTVDQAEKERLRGNIFKMLSEERRPPGTEPGLTSKSERAAVGEAIQKWISALTGPVTVDMNGFSSCIEMKTTFGSKDSCRADQKVEIELFLQSCSPVPITVLEASLVTHNDAYKLHWKGSETLAAGKSIRKAFEFLPEMADVTGSIKVEKIRVKIGSESGFSAELIKDVTQDTDAAEKEQRVKEFIVPNYGKMSEVAVGGDETDSKAEDFSAVDFSSSIEVIQRAPLMTMQLSSAAPVLVGEWFCVSVELNNLETEDNAGAVEIRASLVDAADPIIADTTRMTFDVAAEENAGEPPPTPVTPANGEEGSFDSVPPPLVKTVGAVTKGDRQTHVLFVKTSTTGVRDFKIETVYSVNTSAGVQCQSSLIECISLETIEPFTLETKVLSLRMQPLQQTYTDETFLLTPRIKSLTEHGIKILDSWVELKHPVKLAGPKPPSQLKDAALFKNSVGAECFPLQIRKADLLSPLDVQDFVLGKYVVCWTRHGADIPPTDTTFELGNVRVCLSTLFAEALLPSFGVVRTPLELVITLRNRTSKVQEFSLTMEPSEAFMMSGNKQLHFKVLPERPHALTFVLYPLLAGERVALPALKLTATRAAQAQDANDVLQRLLPKYITVLPRSREEKIEEKKNSAPHYQLGDIVTLDNVPIKVGGKLKPAL